jgi:hypothetical protein
MKQIGGKGVSNWIAVGVAVIAVGFIGIMLVVNTHLSRLRRDLLELRAYLISTLSNH